MVGEMLEVWITKYALTAGISRAWVRRADGDMVVKEDRHWQFFHGEGREWHLTREDAVARAEEMRSAKIASLEKQIDRIKALNFAEKRDKPGCNQAIAT